MKLPGNFEVGKRYLLQGETLIAWRDAILADRIIAGPGIQETSAGKAGRILRAAPGTAAAAPIGAFYGLVTADGHTYLQGGSVTGGHGGSATLDNIKVIDATSGPVAAEDYILYLQVSATATVADGVMLPGCQVNSASTSTAADLPSAHAFTTSAATGNLYLELGRFTADSFLPASPGNVLAGGCIGNFQLTRS